MEPIVLEDLKRVQVRPGDVLVVRVDPNRCYYDDSGNPARDMYVGPLEEAFPDNKVILLVADCEVSVAGPAAA